MIYGKGANEPVFSFGEKVLARVPGARGEQLLANFKPATWVGKSEWSGERFVVLESGAIRHRTVRRLTGAARWDG
eukprot:5971841-Alexandrium_andersonii.AAC.1